MKVFIEQPLLHRSVNNTTDLLLASYLNALERRNSVPGPKRFCKAKKVKSFALLSQNQKILDSRVIDTFLFSKIKLLFVFLFVFVFV